MLWVLQRKRTEKSYLIETSLHDYGGQEIPLSSDLKLETQERQRCNSVWVQSIENQSRDCGKSQSKSRDLVTRSANIQGLETDVPAQAEGKFILPPHLVLSNFSVNWMIPACIGEGNFLYCDYWRKCWSLLETFSQTHPEIKFTAIWAHFSSAWSIKITITGTFKKRLL